MNTLEHIHVKPIITPLAREKWALRKKQLSDERDCLWSGLCKAVRKSLGDLAPLDLNSDLKSLLEAFTSPIIVTFKPSPMCGPIRVRYELQDSSSHPFMLGMWPVIGRGFQHYAIPRVNTQLDWNERVTWADSMQWYFTNDLEEALGASEETGVEITAMQSQSGYSVEEFPIVETLLKGRL